jgi:hypothetical protein
MTSLTVRTSYGFDVIPIDDLRPHKEGPACWCKPRVEECEGGDIVVHNSLDGREKFETGERKPS